MTFDLPDSPPHLPGAQPRALHWFQISRSDLAALAGLAVAYGLTAAVGLQWTMTPGLGAVLWPAAGVGLAGLLIGGVRLWPAILLGRLLAAGVLGSPQPWWGDLLVAAGAALAASLPAWMILRRGGFNPMLANLTDLCWLGLLGGIGGGALSALTGVAALAGSGAPTAALPGLFLSWTLGFAAGVFTVAPLILAWSVKAGWRATPLSWAHLAACVAVTATLVWLIYLRPFGFVRSWHLYPVLIWATIAFNVRGTSILLALIAIGSIAGAAQGLGPNGEMPRQDRMMLAQQFVLITSATMLILAAIADERRATLKLEAANRASLQEIAVRRRAEAHQHLLIQELNHRVKNTLATVQSMVGQTLRTAGSHEDAAQALTSRIIALAEAHDVLTRENWDSADLHDILRSAIRPFESAGAGRVRAAGPRVRLEPACALALAMAFHELATNATKYGALSCPGGRVSVRWTGADGSFEIEWVERDGPPVGAPSRQGFGSRLLQRGLPAQLHGAVTLEYAREGLRCVITADAGSCGAQEQA